MKHVAKISLGLAAAGALLLTGCSASPEPKTATGADLTGSASSARTDSAVESRSSQSDGVRIDPRIVAMCDLPEPRFEFDSAQLSPQADRAMSALAECFTSGPAQGKELRLVGHADPRGELYYNFGLGQRRAGAVASAITERGLPESRISTLSRGELDATGTEEEGWARDRRVEILLVD